MQHSLDNNLLNEVDYRLMGEGANILWHQNSNLCTKKRHNGGESQKLSQIKGLSYNM